MQPPEQPDAKNKSSAGYKLASSPKSYLLLLPLYHIATEASASEHREHARRKSIPFNQ